MFSADNLRDYYDNIPPNNFSICHVKVSVKFICSFVGT